MSYGFIPPPPSGPPPPSAGVTLISAQGQPLGTGLAFVRDLAHLIDNAICYVGWLFPIWDDRRQTIADKIMNTTVITVPKG